MSFREIIDFTISGQESLCEELISGSRISQTFPCRIENLSCVEVKFGTYGRKNLGIVIFSLRPVDQESDSVRIVESLENLQDNSYHSFKFGPLKNSAGREFIFSIESPNCSHGQNVAVWKSSYKFSGQRFLNKNKVNGTICFISKCLVPVSEDKPSFIKIEPNFILIPVYQNIKVVQDFLVFHHQINALSLDLDNFGSIGATLLVDFREVDGDCLLRARILSEQVTNGSFLLLPINPTFCADKVFRVTLSSEDGKPGGVIGVKINRYDVQPGSILQINNEKVDGMLSLSTQGCQLEDTPIERPFETVTSSTKIVFNEIPRQSPPLITPDVSIEGLVDIITLNFNQAGLLLRCYQSLVRNTKYPNWRWLVCDNGSSDNSVDVIERIGDSRVSILKRSDNSFSFGKANNWVFESKVQGEFILFLNNDVYVQKDWLEDMVAILKSDPAVGIVGSRLYYPDGSPQHLGIVFQKDGMPVNLSKYLIDPSRYGFFDEVDRTFRAVTGACFLMRSQDFKQIGGFPAGYDYGYEDVDLCLTVYNTLNKKSIICSGSKSIHEEAATSKKIKRCGRSIDVDHLKRKWSTPSDIHTYFNDFKANLYLGPQISTPLFSIVTCVTEPRLWMENVVRPNRCYLNQVELKPVFNLKEKLPIPVAYNKESGRSKGKYVIFCHQDLKFNLGWFEKLRELIYKLSENWGVIGVAGHSVEGKIRGGLRTPEGIWSHEEGEVQTVDECFLIVKRGLDFDETIIEPHFYGVDICLQSRNRGLVNYAIDLPVEHRETGKHPTTWISDYQKALAKIKKKWSDKFDVIRTTTCVLRKGFSDIVAVKPPRKQ